MDFRVQSPKICPFKYKCHQNIFKSSPYPSRCLQQGGSLDGTCLLHQFVEGALSVLQQGEGAVELLDGTAVQHLEGRKITVHV